MRAERELEVHGICQRRAELVVPELMRAVVARRCRSSHCLSKEERAVKSMS